MKEERKGELYMFAANVLEAFFPILTVLSFIYLPSIVSLAWTTFIAMIFFAVVLLIRGTYSDLRKSLVWRYSVYSALILGIAFYALIFWGLTMTSAGNLSILLLFQVFTSYVFFSVFKGEPFPKAHILGSALMVVGALIVIGRDWSGVNMGDVIILLASVIAPLGNYFQQKVREIAASESTLFVRTLISFPALFLVAALLGETSVLSDVKKALPFLLIHGIFLFGLTKMLWLESIHRISVTKATALYSMTPLFTLLLAWPILGEVPNMWQFISLVPFGIGVLLLTNTLRIGR